MSISMHNLDGFFQNSPLTCVCIEAHYPKGDPMMISTGDSAIHHVDFFNMYLYAHSLYDRAAAFELKLSCNRSTQTLRFGYLKVLNSRAEALSVRCQEQITPGFGLVPGKASKLRREIKCSLGEVCRTNERKSCLLISHPSLCGVCYD